MRYWTPYPAYELEAIESWLNGHAAEGRKLKKWGSIFVTFEEEGEDRHQYYLEADDTKFEPNQERKAENEEQGWEYVCTLIENIHIYRAAVGCKRPADSKELRLKAARKFKNTALLDAACKLLYLVLILGLLLPKKFILLEFMETNWRIALFGLLLIHVILYTSVWNTKKLWKIFAWMKDGRNDAENQLKAQKKQRRIKSGQAVAAHIVLCAALILFVIGSDKKNYVNIGEAYPTVPFVDLQEISGDGFRVSEFQDQEYPGINICNSIQMEPVVFAGEHYITFQDGGDEGGTNSSASLTGAYWKIEPGLISNTLFSQLVSRYTEYEWYRGLFKTVKAVEGEWLTEMAEDSRFLHLTVAVAGEETNRRKDTTLIFAQTGEHVVYLNYSGEKTATELIEALADSLGLQ